MPEESYAEVSRREFIKGLSTLVGGLIAATIAGPAIAFLISPSMRKGQVGTLVQLGELQDYPIGVPTLRQFSQTQVNGWERTGTSYGVFVLRTSESKVRVFSNICTHLGCHVNWHADLQHDVSPCHDGHFDILGKNISGPPPWPLDEFAVRLDNGKLFIAPPPFRRTA